MRIVVVIRFRDARRYCLFIFQSLLVFFFAETYTILENLILIAHDPASRASVSVVYTLYRRLVLFLYRYFTIIRIFL